jgi:hypothetical protein
LASVWFHDHSNQHTYRVCLIDRRWANLHQIAADKKFGQTFATQVEAGLLPKDASTASATYIAGDYLRDAQNS